MVRRLSRQALRGVQRAAVVVAGVVLLIGGIAMIVLPGPAILAIPAGLSLLALEFEWAARLRDRVLTYVKERSAARRKAAADPSPRP